METEPRDALDLRVLGPVAAVRDGAALDLGGVRAQTLLALLAVQVGSPVSADALVEELWAGEPPDGAFTTLRSYVSRLRSALGDDVTIERTTAGYVLAVAPESVDAVRFERAVREADALMERGRQRRAAETLRSALALWRGEPFAGLAGEGTLRSEATRLEELRLHAIESRIGADLESGRAAELVDELEGQLATNPFRERLWLHLMTALYRSGRQADALAAYHRARQALDEQLGIEPGAELRALEAAILRQDVPAAGAAPAPSGSLPVALTRFIGRRRELAEIERLLGRARLVTLTGVGGVGKTRLAIEAAGRALEGQVDRVALVDLAALADQGLVVDHVATAIGGADSGSAGSIGAIREAIGTDDVLLVLDNCEHVHDAAAALAQTLLAGSPDLRILATSRVALDVAGEAPYPVPPLALIESGDDGDGTTSDAVELLLDRASLTRHDLVVDADAYATAARICQDLDGLPLAIELAAARMKALSLDEVAGRIRDRFQFLVSWRRLTSARHRTLRETMDWSYELLEPDEQQLLARLSVFPAGASRASIAVVCLDGDDDEAERLIERLVDASLIVPIEGSRGTRYRQLETVRQYGAGLLPDDDAERLRRRHAEHLLEVALSTGLSLETSGVDPDAAAMSFDVAREELPSLRAAIAWAMTGDPLVALAIACALERFWVSSHVREGAEILTALLELPAVAGHARARVLRCRGGCRYSAGEYEAGMADYEAALAIHRSLGERAHEAHLLMRVAFEADRLGDRRRTQALLDEAAAVGGAARFPTDAYAGASLASRLAFEDGRDDDGFALLREASARTAAVGDSWWRSGIEARIAERAFELGRLDEGGAAARESLRTAVVIDGRQSIAWALGLLAREAAARGLDRRAGMIWGGIEAEVARGPQVEDWEEDRVELLRMITKQSEAAFDEGVLEGHALSLAEVVELGLAEG